MTFNDFYKTTKLQNRNFEDKFREAVNLYELCKNNPDFSSALQQLLNNICSDKDSLYQNDPASLYRTFLYTSATRLSVKALRYVYRDDEYYFKNFYKCKKEYDLANSVELIAKAIAI